MVHLEVDTPAEIDDQQLLAELRRGRPGLGAPTRGRAVEACGSALSDTVLALAGGSDDAPDPAGGRSRHGLRGGSDGHRE